MRANNRSRPLKRRLPALAFALALLPLAGCESIPKSMADLPSIPGIGKVDVNIVWDPMWTPDRMSDEARLVLNMW